MDPKPNAFTEEERDQVIAAFQNDNRKGMNYRLYAPFVEFLFCVGCRPSEAIGLQWQHISEDFGTINFEGALVQVGNRRVRSKGSKNNKTRQIAVSPRVQTLLESIAPECKYAAALEPELGVLGRAIAAYRQRRDLVRCAGDLAGAVAAINCGLEQLERAAQDRLGFAAAVDKVARAVGRSVGREQQKLDAPEPSRANSREQLLERWKQYSAGLPSASLELRVAQRALQDGRSAKRVFRK